MWQTLARKARFIEQVMTARGTGRSVEGDISGGPMPTNYSEIMAASSGNPLIFELANAQHELSRLSRLERAHHDSQRSLSQRKSIAEGALEPTRADIARLAEASARVKLTASDAFRFTTVNGVVVDNRERAAEFARLARLSQEPVRLGELGGHTVMARNYRDFNTYQEVIELQVQGVPEVTTRRMVPYGERVAITNGMVIQFENMVAKIPSKLQEAQLRLAQCQDTIVQCDRLIGRPFPQAVELAAAQDRFQQISGLLQAMDAQAELQDPSAEQAIARARTLTQQANATGTGADARDKLRRMADELRAQGEPPEADREPPTRHDPTR